MRRAIVLAGVLCASDAWADKSEAARLFDEGRALLKDEKFEEACAKFSRSYELERAAGTGLNLGDCAERDGKYGRAWELYDAAARTYDRENRAGAAKATRDKMAALAPKLATIVVHMATPDAQGLALRIADHPAAPSSEVVMLVDPGEIEIVATQPERETFTTTARGVAGKRTLVDVPALAKATKSIATTGTTGDEPGPRQRGRVRLAIGLGIGSGLAAAGGVVFTALALSAKSDASDAGCHEDASNRFVCDTPQGKAFADDAAAKADTATYLAIGTGALLAAALVVYYTAPREHVTVAPLADAKTHTVGLGLSARF